MPGYTTPEIRNILFAGQQGCGKTTLVDAMLFAAGAVPRKGSPATGDSFSDFEKEEKEHGHSVYPSMLRLDHEGVHVNVVDTPGSSDLLGPAIACAPAVETVVVVVHALNGIEAMTTRWMDLAAERRQARAIVVNRVDTPDLDLDGLLAALQERFGSGVLPINLPAGGGKTVVDCVLADKGDSDLGDVGERRRAILDNVVELDDALMERYLGGEEIDAATLHGAFVRAMTSGHLVPVLFTSAKEGAGVSELLSAVAKHFPSPVDGPRQAFLAGTGADAAPADYSADPGKPLLAHVFRVTSDPFVGKLSYFRVHQGHVQIQSQVLVGEGRKSVKLGQVLRLQGKESAPADRVIAGDLGAIAKIEEISPGDVLHDEKSFEHVHVKPLAFPSPLFSLAVTPKSRNDEQKISRLLGQVAGEDPTFRVVNDPQTHELVISGLGELHLRLVLERLKARGVEVDTKPPRIAYKETIVGKADGHYRHKKQTGGAGQFGEVFLRVEPLGRGTGFEFVDDTFGGTIPRQFIPAIEKGVRELLENGIIAGYPVQDVRVSVYDGKTHPVDSKEIAFKTAGKYAFKDAFLKAQPVLLEPIVLLEVTVPEDRVGAITGDLASRRGQIAGTDLKPGGNAVIRGRAPLAEVLQYQAYVKSVTAGRGSFTMELSHYEPVPSSVQAELIAAFKPHETEE